MWSLEALPAHIRDSARVDPNGEVAWHRSVAHDAIQALTDAGQHLTGLDARTYDEDGGIMEIPLADLEGLDAQQACARALQLVTDYDGDDGDWILVTC